MTPIPKAAMPAVRLIRNLVPRPKKLPTLIDIGLGRKALRFVTPVMNHCPVTMLLGTGYRPILLSPFYRWWDVQTDPIAVMDAVWPSKKRRSR